MFPNSFDAQQSTDVSAERPYESPSIVDLGNFIDVTLGTGTAGTDGTTTSA